MAISAAPNPNESVSDDAELEQEAIAAVPSTAPSQGDRGESVGARALGIQRYIQLGFIIGFVALFMIVDKTVAAVWGYFAEPPQWAPALSAFASLATVWLAYRQDSVQTWARGIALELSKVTWPTRAETWAGTVVVLATSVIAAVILGLFDAVWAALTNMFI